MLAVTMHAVAQGNGSRQAWPALCPSAQTTGQGWLHSSRNNWHPLFCTNTATHDGLQHTMAIIHTCCCLSHSQLPSHCQMPDVQNGHNHGCCHQHSKSDVQQAAGRPVSQDHGALSCTRQRPIRVNNQLQNATSSAGIGTCLAMPQHVRAMQCNSAEQCGASPPGPATGHHAGFLFLAARCSKIRQSVSPPHHHTVPQTLPHALCSHTPSLVITLVTPLSRPVIATPLGHSS
mmetsp:Transcript_18206/g.45911  ORF Transcript_18206/g.45911 Transcript_18206/m.45911 type:complete len:232 (+) Transcript_18206:68-763(+)